MNQIQTLDTYLTDADGSLYWSYETPIYRAIVPMPDKKSHETNLPDCRQTIKPFFEMSVPKIPLNLLETTIGFFRWVLHLVGGQSEAAVYLSYLEGQWQLKIPPQQIRPLSVRPEPISALDKVGMVIHSHGLMDAYFSSLDDQGEDDGFLYGVIGNLSHAIPRMRFRVGDRGCFLPVSFGDLWTYQTREERK